MSDLLERLRETPCNREPFTPEHADCQCRVANKAADEIERLRSEVAELRHVVAMAKLPTEPTIASRAFPNPFKI